MTELTRVERRRQLPDVAVETLVRNRRDSSHVSLVQTMRVVGLIQSGQLFKMTHARESAQ